MDPVIKNGTVVTATETFKADVAVENGKIAAIGGTVSSDDYFAGTRAAACGGTTTVFDFALQDFGESMTDCFKRRNALAAPDAAVDYSFHIGVKDISGGLIDTIGEACEMGITSYKVFMVYDFGVKDGVFYQLLSKAKDYGALIAVHAENNELVNTLTEQYISEGKTGAWYHYMSRPEFVEGEADERAISLAKAAGAALYIVHLANKQGVDAVTKAKDEGYEIYAETCPQYLHFTSDVYKRADGRNFVCSPPMKGQESQDALWAAINTIKSVTTARQSEVCGKTAVSGYSGNAVKRIFANLPAAYRDGANVSARTFLQSSKASSNCIPHLNNNLSRVLMG